GQSPRPALKVPGPGHRAGYLVGEHFRSRAQSM
ncbi:hypothetical protein, partial [Pseudomonas sp. FEN]